MNVLLILGIDTSGKTATAALLDNGIFVGQNSVYTAKTHSQVILPMVKKLLADCGKELSELSGIAVAAGPGSYTGLRIGISAVKAMSFALNIPCYGVSSLEGLAYSCGRQGIICSIMKARKDLVYTAVYKNTDDLMEVIFDEKIVSMSELNNYLGSLCDDSDYKNFGKITLTGDGAEEFFNGFSSENYSLSSKHLRLQNACGICLAAQRHAPQSPEGIEARYLQLVKAEKDLLGTEKNK